MIAEIGIGIGGAAVLFGIRQLVVRRQFLERYKSQILEGNEEIVETWRDSGPKENHTIVERRFRPPVLLAPTVAIRRRYRRDPRPWYVRLFS